MHCRTRTNRMRKYFQMQSNAQTYHIYTCHFCSATLTTELLSTGFSIADLKCLRTFHSIVKNMNLSEARAACRTNYTDLVTVYSDEDNTALNNLIDWTKMSGSGVWIGLIRSQSSDKWSNGDDVTFNNLAGVCGSGSCCAAMKADGSWESFNCTDNRTFMCYKRDTDLTLKYHLISENMSWYEAQSYCRKSYTDLVSIRDHNQNEAVRTEGLKNSTSFWIGLLRDDWEWTDGGRSAYRNWATGYPRLSPSDCATLRKGKWETGPFSNIQPAALCYSISDHHSDVNGSCESILDCCNKGFSPAPQRRLRTFHVTGNKKNYTEARAACRTNYTDLVTVYSDEDNTALEGVCSAWIGLNRNQSSDKWSNGDNVTFSNLTGVCGSGSCCAAMKVNGSWESLNCTEKRNFMCYKQDVTDFTFNYYLISENMSWYEAQSYCRKSYTDLVSITDQNQNEAVRTEGLKNSNTSFWIGLLCDDWEWTDGGRSAYRNWGNGQSETTPSDCVTLSSGTWSSVPCGINLFALCYSSFIHVSNDSMTWEDALDYCRKDNRTGFLRIQSESDQKEVEFELKRRRVVSGTLWVGLGQSQLFGFWMWTDGIGVGPWSNWVGGRQPEPPLSHHCGVIDTEEGFKWRDKDCRSKFRVLCEVKKNLTDPLHCVTHTQINTGNTFSSQLNLQ